MNPIRLAYIGAGGVNFGGCEGPWDHASRFEQLEGVVCVGVADVLEERARDVIARRMQGAFPHVWQDARAYKNFRTMINEVNPDAVIVGLPPDAHGTLEEPFDVEITLAEKGIHFLLEKPIAMLEPQVTKVIAKAVLDSGVVSSVGYMFRYSKAVNKMREILARVPGGPRMYLARYDTAYSELDRAMWWDKRRCGGPIIEQATHLLDLARFICGEVDMDSIQVQRILPTHKAKGVLQDAPMIGGKPIDADVPPEYQIPRGTMAQWQFGDGAIGSLAHGVQLHQKAYSAEIEVWADGVRLVLQDPYVREKCKLGIRTPDSEDVQWIAFDDDFYMAEAQAFIDAVRGARGESSQLSDVGIQSSYLDSTQTYSFTWRITEQRAPADS